MADNLPTVWHAEPHTIAKHAILERYLEAWFPILSQQSQRVRQQADQILFIGRKRGEKGAGVESRGGAVV